MDALLFFDYAGVAIFAATGSLAASRKQLDLIGFLFLAGITGVGGGTIRDLLLGETPVFWVTNPVYVIICTSVALLFFFTAHMLESRYKLLLWLDALGISTYAVMGAAKGYIATGSATIAIVTGVLTATLGGILRDILAGEKSALLRPEIYITAALIGAASYTFATIFGAPVIVAATLGFITTFVIRGGALLYGWSIPAYKSRAGRNPEDIQ